MAALINYNTPIYRKSIETIAKELPIRSGKVLITGATGLIGSCLIDVLQVANDTWGASFEIYALSRNEERLKNRFKGMNDVHYVAQNIIDPIHIEELDYIIHAASNADPRSYALYPAETMTTNVLGAKTVCDYCSSNKRTRVLLTSTFEVYGRLEKDEYSEDDFGLLNMNHLRSSYPGSKRLAELLFRAYHDEYDVDCVIARLSSIYGPTMLEDDSKAHAQFIRNGINGEDIILKSEGKQKRTYCYVMDAVNGLFSVLFKGKTGEAYNVANEQSIATIAEVANVVADISGTNVVFALPNESEKKGFSIPQNCVLKTDKIKALGWNGKYDLKSGMSETLTILKESLC